MRAHARKGSTDSLHYLQQMLEELRSIAESEKHAMLAYLIEMAYIEVTDIIRGTAKRPRRRGAPGDPQDLAPEES